MCYNKSESNGTSLYDRVKKLLVSFDWSDCSFSISGQDFRAHKLILGISSPVFEAMFYGPMATNESNIIITDIDADIFQLLINYIYTDKVHISSIEEAFELLYASNKYILEQLSEMCITYIMQNISIENVIPILNYPDFMQDIKLISCALKLFCEHANYLLHNNKSMITLPCMKTILESNDMNIVEKDLIKQTFDWAKQQCVQKNIPDLFQNKRDFLINNGLFKLLRFSTLSIEDLNDIVTYENNLLMACEVEKLKCIIRGARNKLIVEMGVDSIQTPRNPLQLKWYLCYRSPLKPVAPFVIDSNNYTINCRVKANRCVFITSLCVPTRVAPLLNFHDNTAELYSEQISVSVTCESDNSIILATNFMNKVEYDSFINIQLSEPCFIKREKWYKFSFVWPPYTFLSYSYMVECRDRFFVDHKVTFEFEDLPLTAGNCGSFLGGLKFCL